jgi:hypothetical protein
VKQQDAFAVNIDDLEDCTCRLGTVFGGDYWDAPPTTTPEECEAHQYEVAQRRPTGPSLRFAKEMERLRLARPAPPLPPLTAPPVGGTVTAPIGHDEILRRIDARSAAEARQVGSFVYRWDETGCVKRFAEAHTLPGLEDRPADSDWREIEGRRK